jgi:hypothetical protein
MRVYPKVSGLAAWSANVKWYSSLPLGAVVSLFCEFCRHDPSCCFSASFYCCYFAIDSAQKRLDTPSYWGHQVHCLLFQLYELGPLGCFRRELIQKLWLLEYLIWFHLYTTTMWHSVKTERMYFHAPSGISSSDSSFQMDQDRQGFYRGPNNCFKIWIWTPKKPSNRTHETWADGTGPSAGRITGVFITVLGNTRNSRVGHVADTSPRVRGRAPFQYV